MEDLRAQITAALSRGALSQGALPDVSGATAGLSSSASASRISLLDEPAVAHEPTPTCDQFRCPGEAYSISRAVHLGRLASYYPACRECAHRADARLLPAPIMRGWSEVLNRPEVAASFTAEGYEARSTGALTIDDVRAVALALGTVAWQSAAWRSRAAATSVPRVLLGGDGHWSTADLVHAASEALLWAGCRAVDVGAVTTPALACGAQARGCDAALWIGNATGMPHAIALRCFGGGRPWSSPGELDAVRTLVASLPQRPKRGGGGVERAEVTEDYLAPLEPWFHALRPLRFVVDTTCEPWLASMNRLANRAACEIVRAAGPEPPELLPPAAESWLERRLRSIGRRGVSNG